jgi:hypothetical protein
MSVFAQTIVDQKYAHTKIDGSKETWPEIAYRVAKNVLKTVNASKQQIELTARLITERKFIPGGRYLYASGRPFHQVQNCLLMRVEDSREGWADHLQKCAMALMTGAGIGIDYSLVREEGAVIGRTGGFATGPLALMQMTNECGRGIMQGGSRRSAIWAGLNWAHPDVHKFIQLKNWSPEVRAMKEKDFNFPATMDGTNISVQLDDEFFKAYHSDKHKLHSHAHSVYWAVVRQMLSTAEPGFSVDCGENAGETLRNAPVVGGTNVLTIGGVKRVSEMVGEPQTVWTGRQWARDVVFHKTGDNVPTFTVTMTGGRSLTCDPSHPFIVERYIGKGKRRKLVGLDRVAAGELIAGDVLHVSLPPTSDGWSDDNGVQFVDHYTMGFLYGDGHFRDGHAEVSIFTESKRRCFDLLDKSSFTHSLDAKGNRIYFNTNREQFGGRTKDVFPEDYRRGHFIGVRAFLAGLFDADGSYDEEQNRIRLGSIHRSFLLDCQRMLEGFGIQSSVGAGSNSGFTGEPSWQLTVAASSVSEFARVIPTIRIKPDDHDSYRPYQIKVLGIAEAGNADIYCADVKVPEHTFMAEGIIISNCTEVTSRDDSDICNLGSINMAQINSLEEMRQVVEVGTYFLLAGTEYSDVPFQKVADVRTKNRRLGLGLMGLHEWMLKRSLKYGASEELATYLDIYATSTELAAAKADQWGISRPVKTRAIAPTGTIGILAETTTGVEPVFCVAYKRRYLKGSVWHYQYVLDPTAKRLIDAGVPWDSIEDAYTLAENPERRVAFQAWLQKYVDHSISSTLNLPAWGSETNNESKVQDFGKMLIKYLPDLRGITCYPDGARGGQPLTPVRYATAVKHVGEIFVEAMDICELSKGGSCGS